MFLGEYMHTLDAKNRLTLPAKLRDEMGGTAILAKNIDKCISVYNKEAWAAYTAKLEALPDTEVRSLKRFIYSSAFEAAFDAQGRLLIPQNLCDFAGIGKEDGNVRVIGAGDHAELWSDSAWDKIQNETDMTAMEATMIRLGF